MYRSSQIIPKDFENKEIEKNNLEQKTIVSSETHKSSFKFELKDHPLVINIKWMKSRKYENYLMVLQHTGNLHIVRAIDTSMFQTNIVNIGSCAVFDIDDDDTRLCSVDIDMKLRIFLRHEESESNYFKFDSYTQEDKLEKSPQPLLRKNTLVKNNSICLSPIKRRKVTVSTRPAEVLGSNKNLNNNTSSQVLNKS